MGSGLASWKLLFLLLVCAYRSGARKTTEKQWKVLDLDQQKEVPGNNVLELPGEYGGKHSKDDIHAEQDPDAHQEIPISDVHAHPSSHSHMNHIQNSSVFFTIKDLKVGKVFHTNFFMNDPSISPHLLPREKADSIPFSSEQLPYLLHLFSYSHDSPQAKAVAEAIRLCEADPIKGETKFCATSLESMLDFVRSIFRVETEFLVLSTTQLTKTTATFKNYTIPEVPKEIYAPKMVACHTMSYPYTIFYCHSQDTENKVFKVSLEAGDGDRVEAVAVCHMDTSQWSPDHLSFRLIGIKPGKNSNVCHFFPTDHLVFVPKSTY